MSNTDPLIALIQMKTGKADSLETAVRQIARCAEAEADFAVLPEMFSCPYETTQFASYAQKRNGILMQTLSECAAKHHIYIVGGSFPEEDHGAYYNSSPVFDRSGNLLTIHRKMHLFDIDIPGRQCFRESDVLSAGKDVTVFDTEFGKMGLCVCYDIRFPELFRLMTDRGAEFVFCPAAFNPVTGPKHWELLFRARAVDNQIFMIGAAPAADPEASYHSYGHSCVVSPWGEVLAQAEEEETILFVRTRQEEIREVRSQLPLLKHRRSDLYRVTDRP